MVVAGGFEPPTPALSTRCSNQLSYATERVSCPELHRSFPFSSRRSIIELQDVNIDFAGVYRVLVIHWVERA